jgi:DNA primase large subunit
MDSTILVAIITGLCTAVPCVIATFTTNNTREALQSERLSNMSQKIDELTTKIEQLSSFDKRLSILEQMVERIVEDMKGETHQ